MNSIKLDADISTESQDEPTTLSDLELAMVGGGMGDVSFG